VGNRCKGKKGEEGEEALSGFEELPPNGERKKI
jgi:hypothetical protein